MLELIDVSKRYHVGQANEVTAVQGVTLRIKQGSTVVFKGPSGSGKTTLLALIGCLARPTEGRILWQGQALSGLPEHHLTNVRRQTVGFAFQRFNLLNGMDVLTNVMLPAYPLGLPHAELTAQAFSWLSTLKLEHRAYSLVEQLSGGEMQRVAIARALINDPEIVIADEPTANLDSALSTQFLDIALTLKARGKTVLISSHDPRVWQSTTIDHTVEMADGRVVGVDG